MLARLGRLSNWLGFNRASSRKPEEDDLDLSWLYPPDNPEDVAGWDRHWAEQVAHGLGPQIFDLFCDDRKFVTMMNDQGMRRILCAGNGISQEPQALAAAGFDVVALDISPQATEIARSLAPIPERLRHYIDDSMRRPGGHVDFVVGDIRDSAICRGPFDLIIERCTAQLYANRGLDTLINKLAERLDSNGILFSHCHDRAWRPPAEPRHPTRSWFEQNGWTIWNSGSASKPPGRVACFFSSTG